MTLALAVLMVPWLPAGGALAAADAAGTVRGQDVTIIAGQNRTIYEYRQNGVLRQIKVVPRIGRPYYLVPADETRAFSDLENAGRLVPRWTIIEF